MTKPAVVLDACVLIPIRLATTLLWLAESRVFQPLWSDEILEEVERNLPKVGVAPTQAARRVDLMRTAFGSESLIEDYMELIDLMKCDPKDRHVLACAIAGGADRIITMNLKDFPAQALYPFGIKAMHPDIFLVELLEKQPATVMKVLAAELASFKNPPTSTRVFLDSLVTLVPNFAQEALKHQT